MCKKRKKEDKETEWWTNKKGKILSGFFWCAVIFLTTFYVAMYDFKIPLSSWVLGRGKIFLSIYGLDFDAFYETQINLIVTAISTVAIITAFLDKWYLGRNYTHWCFKETLFLLTPQDIILLMVFNQFAGALYMVTGKYRAISLASIFICWVLFACLLYQVHVFVIKVSHLLHKIMKRMNKDADFRRRTREALLVVGYVDERNLYVIEEGEIILRLLELARKDGLSQDEIQNLKQALIRKVENEAYVRCGCFDRLDDRQLKNEDKENIERVMRDLALEIVKKRIGIAYDPKRTAKDNLISALEVWCPQNQKAD